MLHLANYVARELREKHPEAWVGLYAYSTHRLPPTIAVEPNVYVQVAMGFNRTQYTLAELVELWSKKVGAIGLREYYGVEAWDWGLPGRIAEAKSIIIANGFRILRSATSTRSMPKPTRIGPARQSGTTWLPR